MNLVLRGVMALVLLWARFEAAVMPVSWLYSMGRASARTLYLWVPGIRRALEANARVLLGPDSTPLQRRRHSIRVLEGFSRFFVELLTAPDTYPTQAAFLERVEGLEHAKQAWARGKGVIGISLHMGNMELGPLLLRGLVHPMAIVYRKDPFGLVEAMRSRARQASEIEEIDTGPALFGVRVLDVLRRGGFCFLAGDLGFPDPTRRGHEFSFFGRPARFLVWPARLALASGAPLLPCFVLRDPRGAYFARIEPPLEPVGTPEELTQRLVEIYERYVAAYPEQWLILHPYWEGVTPPSAAPAPLARAEPAGR